MAIDNDKLQEFLGKFVGDLGATVAAGNVVVGHNLGLYQALATGPATAQELASRTETDPLNPPTVFRGKLFGKPEAATITASGAGPAGSTGLECRDPRFG